MTLCITFKCVSVCAGDWTEFLTHAKLPLPLNHTSSPQINLQQTQSCSYWFSFQKCLVVPRFYTTNQQTATWHEDPVEYSSLYRSKGSRYKNVPPVLSSQESYPPHPNSPPISSLISFLDACRHILYHLQEQPTKCRRPCLETSMETSLQQVTDAEGQSLRTRGQRCPGSVCAGGRWAEETGVWTVYKASKHLET